MKQGHEELDAASLREHKEFTKVKNIATIELGRYEIETWYFSPFPSESNDCLKLFFYEFCLNFIKRKEQLQRHMVSYMIDNFQSLKLIQYRKVQHVIVPIQKFWISISKRLAGRGGLNVDVSKLIWPSYKVDPSKKSYYDVTFVCV
ncbi:hypothetical protein TSUD_365960 [Trifolium subterraneum]|uniref:Histone acetyltransferase n=1 Tax=Trifolium subterraneum TaxID=3900 RepID=A0A2Z6PBM6_TRISU|nr:hypothetical protein TSUD_365960 [Trifolium subterraneum]